MDMIFEDTFSLTPNKLSTYTTILKKSPIDEVYKHRATVQAEYNKISRDKGFLREVGNNRKNSLSNLEDNTHKWYLSSTSRKKIIDKVNWLYQLSESKNCKTSKGKTIHNFKCAFITLTLPAKQHTSTSIITKVLFNQFLTEIRQRFQVVNYVWRLEFQKNGNVHYHLVTDVFIDYFLLRSIWNRIIDKFGYRRAYANKMNSLSLLDYFKKYGNNYKNDFNKCKEVYAKGKKENWLNPNTVDVKNVSSGANIGVYIAKYIGKEKENSIVCNELDKSNNSSNIRLWYCSRSLSKLKKISEYSVFIKNNILDLIIKGNKVFKKVYDYATVYYFNVSDFGSELKSYLNTVFKKHAINCGYFNTT